jgi:hypothetical protein
MASPQSPELPANHEQPFIFKAAELPVACSLDVSSPDFSLTEHGASVQPGVPTRRQEGDMPLVRDGYRRVTPCMLVVDFEVDVDVDNSGVEPHLPNVSCFNMHHGNAGPTPPP